MDGMLRRMPSRLFFEWMEFDRREPFGPERADYRSAQIANILQNVYRKEGVPPFSVEDSRLLFGDAEALKKPEPTGKSWQELELIAIMACAAYGDKSES